MRVEKVAYEINWVNFKVGYSFFIPCLDTAEAREEIRRVTKRLGYDIVMKDVIELNIRGVRIWRV